MVAPNDRSRCKAGLRILIAAQDWLRTVTFGAPATSYGASSRSELDTKWSVDTAGERDRSEFDHQNIHVTTTASSSMILAWPYAADDAFGLGEPKGWLDQDEVVMNIQGK